MYIAQIIGLLVAGFGSIGAIIYFAIKFSADRIAERLKAKYELTLNKEMESFKSKLEGKQYISKTRFDVEFAIYRELSKSFFAMILYSTNLYPKGMVSRPFDKEDAEKLERETFDNANKLMIETQNLFYENRPFISEDFDIQFEEILSLCKKQVVMFERRYNISWAGASEKDRYAFEEGLKNTAEIMEKWKLLSENMRKYLFSLNLSD